MTGDKVFYTATMAKVHAGQGNLQKAAEIYRHLLRQQPDRKDLMAELSGIEGRIQQEHAGGRADLIRLIGTWMELLMEYNHLKKLKKLQSQAGTGSIDSY